MSSIDYTLSEQKVLVLTPVLPAILSLTGSGTIIYIILYDRARKLRHVYHRILLVMSTLDVINSTTLALSSLLVPRDAGIWGAQGNIFTCNLGGLLLQIGLGVPMYTACLSLHFVAVITFGKDCKKTEPLMHFVSVVFPVISAIFAWSQQSFNPVSGSIGWCYITDNPPNCSYADGIECNRGQNWWTIFMIASAGPLFMAFGVVLACMIWISVAVGRQEIRANKFRYAKSVNKTRETYIQGMIFVFGFLISYLPTGIMHFANIPTTPEYAYLHFPVSIVVKLMLPSQGIWNSMAFLRPRYKTLRRRYDDSSFFEVMKAVIFKDYKPSQRNSHSFELSFSSLTFAGLISKKQQIQQQHKFCYGDAEEKTSLSNEIQMPNPPSSTFHTMGNHGCSSSHANSDGWNHRRSSIATADADDDFCPQINHNNETFPNEEEIAVMMDHTLKSESDSRRQSFRCQRFGGDGSERQPRVPNLGKMLRFPARWSNGAHRHDQC